MTLQIKNDAGRRLPAAESLMRLIAFRKLWLASAFEGGRRRGKPRGDPDPCGLNARCRPAGGGNL